MQWFVVCAKRQFSNTRLPWSNTATLWLKEYEPALMKESPKMTVLSADNKSALDVRKRLHIDLKGKNRVW